MITVTYSDLQTFQTCPRQWYFRVYRRLSQNRKPVTGALPLGGRVHSALEAYEDGTVGSPVDAWDAMVAHDEAVMIASGMSTDDLAKDHKLGRTMLEGFVEWESEVGFHDKYEVIGNETPMSSALVLPEFPDVEIVTRGKLDRLLRRRMDGSLWVNDYKTMGTFSERDRMGLQRSPQSRMYVMLARQQMPEDQWVAGMVYSMLRKVLRTARANPPFYDVMEIPISDHDLEQYRIRLVAMTRRVVDTTAMLDSGVDHREAAYFHPSWQCQTCPFKHPCALMQDTSLEAAEDYIGDYYTEGDPWERYADHLADD